jgi:predicted peroxiredoxin
MNPLRSLLLLGTLVLTPLRLSAAPPAPLFVNMTTDEAYRATMAIGFGRNQLSRGHGLTLFLNDKGVKLASKANAVTFGEQQKQLKELVEKGATIFVCPMCMKHYGIQDADLLPGLKVSSPELVEKALFADATRTLSW